MNTTWLVDWSDEHTRQLDVGNLYVRHRLAESGLFDDDGLIKIMDQHPSQYLTISTMGDVGERFRWEECDSNGLSGAEIFEIAQRGRIWINVMRLLDHHPEVSRVINEAYDELEIYKPGFKAVKRSANLIVSAPNAQVYYHIDAPCNILWHLRGEKRAWVYPLREPFATAEVLEAIHAGVQGEDAPYDPAFDNSAEVFDLQPGDMVTWAQNTPHRVENGNSLNVSISTEHLTWSARRRINVHLANRLLRSTLGNKDYATDVTGAAALGKVALMRGMRAASKLVSPKPDVNHFYQVANRLDLNSPCGFVPKEEDPKLVPNCQPAATSQP